MSRMDAGNVEEGRVVTEARDATSSSRNNAGDAMLEEAERSALLLLRRELAASRQATERERLVAKRACEQLAEERSAAAEREEEVMKMETRLEALMEGTTREASHRDASPSHHEEADEVTRRISASSPPAAAKLFKTPHTAGEDDDDDDEDDDDDDDDDDDHDANVDPRAVAAAEALLARADALEHEHAHTIASLNARIRALERALSASEGAARVAEAAANEVVAQSASAMERDADAIRRHQDLELEARDLARRLDREMTRSNAWKTRALNAEAKMEETRKAAQRAARDAEMESIAARERSLAEARASGTFEEKVARASAGSSSASSGDRGGRSAGAFSRKMSTGRVAVRSPSVAEVGEKVQKVHPSGKPKPGTAKARAPSARLMVSLASPMAPSSLRPSMDHGGSSPLNAGSKTERDALRASLSRQSESLARLAVARETRRAEMSLLRDTIHALGALEAS
mmetsp:Transcript_2303/g.11217  ORF Transcript_2303/g.11217 Transcript_2303/m.11217 type:complete len:461 (+) Transcript_2303:104-1486(+)